MSLPLSSSSSSSSSSSPPLYKTKLYTSLELRSNPSLSEQITHLVNSAFLRSRQPSSDAADSKWDNTVPRFTSPDALHAMLSDERSVMAVIFDSSSSSSPAASTTTSATSSSSATSPEEEEREEDETQAIPIACAAAIPWAGGWHKEGSTTEHGWEIKTVCVHDDAKYLRKGLAVQLLRVLEDYLVGVEQREAAQGAEKSGGGKLTLWILAAECINGVYWRKRGYVEVRRRTERTGAWGCRTEFDMVVFKREVGV